MSNKRQAQLVTHWIYLDHCSSFVKIFAYLSNEQIPNWHNNSRLLNYESENPLGTNLTLNGAGKPCGSSFKAYNHLQPTQPLPIENKLISMCHSSLGLTLPSYIASLHSR